MACIGPGTERRVVVASALNATLGVQAIPDRKTLENKEKSAILASNREKSRLVCTDREGHHLVPLGTKRVLTPSASSMTARTVRLQPCYSVCCMYHTRMSSSLMFCMSRTL